MKGNEMTDLTNTDLTILALQETDERFEATTGEIIKQYEQEKEEWSELGEQIEALKNSSIFAK